MILQYTSVELRVWSTCSCCGHSENMQAHQLHRGLWHNGTFFSTVPIKSIRLLHSYGTWTATPLLVPLGLVFFSRQALWLRDSFHFQAVRISYWRKSATGRQKDERDRWKGQTKHSISFLNILWSKQTKVPEFQQKPCQGLIKSKFKEYFPGVEVVDLCPAVLTVISTPNILQTDNFCTMHRMAKTLLFTPVLEVPS